ncbi:TRAP transporter substrate-binding protein DctP [Sporosarcina sp. FSL W8-0480]|uniref:TRAP transporter substrate-binding protein DctP n=1 Tax=Sporosarcina sp. FSL W8-0480 TaxID=2954701 RepID=UPI0030D7889C
MKKLSILLVAMLLLVLSACSESSSKSEEKDEKYVLKFGTHLTENHNLTVNAVIPWMKRVEELTDGRVTFEHYPNSQMGAAADTFNLVQSGVLDAGYTLYMEKSLPIMDFPMLPDLYSDPEAGTAAYWSVLKQEPFKSQLQKIGIKPIMAVVWEPYTIATVDTKPESIKELAQLKLRSSGGLHDEAAAAIGSTPVAISASESLEALRRGTVDGYWGSTTSWLDYQFTEVLKYGIKNLPLNGWGGVFSMNNDTYESLPSDIQAAIDQASEEVTEELGKFIKEYTSVEAWKLAEEAGMEIYDVSDEVVAEVKSRLTPLTEKWLEEQEKAGYPAREIYKQFLEAYEGY